MFRKIQHIHFVGIGGAGMSGIAEVLLTLSYHVTGSDLHESESVRRIRALGRTVFIGHARLGRGDLLVAEADESDGSFMKLSPTVVVVTNVDREHLDHYGTMERLCETFLDFINKVPFYGLSVLCADDPSLAALLPRVIKRYQTYGLTSSADLVGTDVQLHVGVAEFSARLRGAPLGRFKVAMPGIHNVRNALAAIAVGLELGVTIPHIDQALAGFKGVERRFQVLGEKGGVLVVDDYGHHPTEIKAARAAAQNGGGRRLVGVV